MKPFKVGDKVIANEGANRYGWTRKGWEGVVKQVTDSGAWLNVEGLSRGGIPFVYRVRSDYFDLVKKKPRYRDWEFA